MRKFNVIVTETGSHTVVQQLKNEFVVLAKSEHEAKNIAMHCHHEVGDEVVWEEQKYHDYEIDDVDVQATDDDVDETAMVFNMQGDSVDVADMEEAMFILDSDADVQDLFAAGAISVIYEDEIESDLAWLCAENQGYPVTLRGNSYVGVSWNAGGEFCDEDDWQERLKQAKAVVGV